MKYVKNCIYENFLPYSNDNNLKTNCTKVERSYYIDCGLNVEATNVGNEKIFLWMLKYTDGDVLSESKLKNVTINPELINGMIQSEETISIDIKESKKPTTLFFVYGKNIYFS